MKRTTRAIVQGSALQRWKQRRKEKKIMEKENCPVTAPMNTVTAPVNTMTAPATAASKKRSATVYIIVAAVSIVFLMLGIILGTLLTPAKQKTPEKEPKAAQAVDINGKCIVTLPLSGLDALIARGDLVAVCTRSGMVPALQYVQVYLVGQEQISLCLSEVQLKQYVALPSDGQSIVLRCKGTDSDAADFLAWQTAFNAPTVQLSVSEDKLTLPVGEQVQVDLQIAVEPPEADSGEICWESADESVATVDGNGVVTGIASGNAVITATCRDRSVSCTVNVIVPVAELTLEPAQTVLAEGGTLALTATVLPEDATDNSVTWSSDNEDVATVNADGTVTAVSVGEAKITASCGEKTAECIVTVAPPVSEVQISHGTLRLYAGQSSNVLKATVLPGNAADKAVTWQSSDTKIVAVTKDGTITCLAAGQATITASCGGKSASCVVTVVNKP